MRKFCNLIKYTEELPSLRQVRLLNYSWFNIRFVLLGTPKKLKIYLVSNFYQNFIKTLIKQINPNLLNIYELFIHFFAKKAPLFYFYVILKAEMTRYTKPMGLFLHFVFLNILFR